MLKKASAFLTAVQQLMPLHIARVIFTTVTWQSVLAKCLGQLNSIILFTRFKSIFLAWHSLGNLASTGRGLLFPLLILIILAVLLQKESVDL